MNICDKCAPDVPGKPFAVMQSGKTHVCYGGKVATSRVVSWHASREAAARAASTYRRKVAKGARTYVLKKREMVNA